MSGAVRGLVRGDSGQRARRDAGRVWGTPARAADSFEEAARDRGGRARAGRAGGPLPGRLRQGPAGDRSRPLPGHAVLRPRQAPQPGLTHGGRQPQRRERVELRRRHQGLPDPADGLPDLRKAAGWPGRAEAVRHAQVPDRHATSFGDRLQAGRLDGQLRHRPRGAGLGGEGAARSCGPSSCSSRPPRRGATRRTRGWPSSPVASRIFDRCTGEVIFSSPRSTGQGARWRGRTCEGCAAGRRRSTPVAQRPRRARKARAAEAGQEGGDRGPDTGPAQGAATRRAWTAGPRSSASPRSPRRSGRCSPACGCATPASGRAARSTSSSTCPARAGRPRPYGPAASSAAPRSPSASSTPSARPSSPSSSAPARPSAFPSASRANTGSLTVVGAGGRRPRIGWCSEGGLSAAAVGRGRGVAGGAGSRRRRNRRQGGGGAPPAGGARRCPR